MNHNWIWCIITFWLTYIFCKLLSIHMNIIIFWTVSYILIYKDQHSAFSRTLSSPHNSFGAGAVMQYNDFLKVCDDKTLTSHEWDSLSMISIRSEISILSGFHTIMRSKLNFKTQLNISLVSNLLGVISVKPPRCPLRVTRPEAPPKRYFASTVVVSRIILSPRSC